MSLTQLPSHARCWIYQADRALTGTEKEWIKEQLNRFIPEWNAHGTKLIAEGEQIGDFHIVLAVDEHSAGASGCSIDSSVRFIKQIGQELHVDFFNRMKILLEDSQGSQQLVAFSEINNYPDYTVFNNLVQNLGEWKSNWKVKATESPYWR